MQKVLDFNLKLAAKKESEEADRMIKYFFEMFGDQPTSVKLEIMEAIQNKDEKRYFEITNPIVYRKAMKEANKGGIL